MLLLRWHHKINKLEIIKEVIMLDIIPSTEQMTNLVGKSLYDIWNKLCVLIDEKYLAQNK